MRLKSCVSAHSVPLLPSRSLSSHRLLLPPPLFEVSHSWVEVLFSKVALPGLRTVASEIAITASSSAQKITATLISTTAPPMRPSCRAPLRNQVLIQRNHEEDSFKSGTTVVYLLPKQLDEKVFICTFLHSFRSSPSLLSLKQIMQVSRLKALLTVMTTVF